MKTILNKRRLRNDYIIAFLILITPFLFYTYLFFPQDNIIKTSLFEYTFPFDWDLEYVVWIFLTKLLALVMFSLWFISCVHWWRYSILSIIYMTTRIIYSYIIGFIFGFDEHVLFKEEHLLFEFEAALVFMVFYLFLVYLSQKLTFYNPHQIKLLIDANEILTKTNNNEIEAKIHSLKVEKEKLSSSQYLRKLVALRNKIDNSKIN